MHDRHGAKQPERFDPAKAARLDDPERFAYLPPEKVENLLDAPQGGAVVDFGAGTGTYAIELARLRPDITVIALDEQQEMLDLLLAKLKNSPQPNVKPLLAKGEEDSHLTVDRILAINVLHELGDKALEEIVNRMKPGGRILFIDWNSKVGRPVGPPNDHVYSPEEARQHLEKYGFSVREEVMFPYHYAFVCEKG